MVVLVVPLPAAGSFLSHVRVQPRKVKQEKGNWYHRIITKGEAGTEERKRFRTGQWMRGYMSIQRFSGIAKFGQLSCDRVTYISRKLGSDIS
jgi:hypothetical protein